jgi:hypothetical protein
MLTDTDKSMMMRFLEINYPIRRIKHNTRFRRGIILEGREFILGDETQHMSLRFKLIDIVKKIFYCDDNISRTIVNNFLNLR